MPTYEYRCRECGRDFEVFQRMSDEPVAPCPNCGRGARRLISGGAGLLFKGDGFYITDHRSESYRERARQEAGAAAGGKDDSKGGDKAEGGNTGQPGKPREAGKTPEPSGKRREPAAGKAD